MAFGPPVSVVDQQQGGNAVVRFGGGFKLSRAAVEDTTLTLDFNQVLDPNSVPAAGDFTVTYGTTDQTPTAVAINDKRISLTVTEPGASVSVTVDYTAGTNPIQNGAGEALPDFANARVVNRETETFSYRFDALDDLNAIFSRVQTGTNDGVWQRDTGGSTGSGGTGPGTNSTGAYVYSEMSGNGSLSQKKNNSHLTFNDSAADIGTWLGGQNRKVEFEICAQSGGPNSGTSMPNGFAASATSGVSVDGLRTGGGADEWERIAFINGWPYSISTVAGDTITLWHSGRTFECSRTGGWIKWEVTLPSWAADCRLIVETEGTGSGWANDMAMYALVLTHGGA